MKKLLPVLVIFLSTSIKLMAQCTSSVSMINNQPAGVCQTQGNTTTCFGWSQTVCANGCVVLSPTVTVNVVSQQWVSLSPNTTITSPMSLQTQVCSGNVLGTDLISLLTIDMNGCTTIVYCSLMVTTCSGQAEFYSNLSEQCNVFPNPTSGKITFEVPYTLHNASLSLYNMLGEMVEDKTQTIENNSTFDITHLSKGMYIIEIKTENAIIRKYVVKS